MGISEEEGPEQEAKTPAVTLNSREFAHFSEEAGQPPRPQICSEAFSTTGRWGQEQSTQRRLTAYQQANSEEPLALDSN